MESIKIYREKIKEFYDRISAYVQTKPDIYAFLESKEKEFSHPDVPAEQSEMMLFDWVIFDYKDAYGGTLLDKFIKDTAPAWEDKATYAGFKDNHFGLTVANKISSKPPMKKEKGGIGIKTLEQRLRIIYEDNFKLDSYIEDNVYVAHLNIDLFEYKVKVLATR